MDEDPQPEEGPFVSLNLQRLVEEWNILHANVWGVGQLDLEAVRLAMREGRLLDREYSNWGDHRAWTYQDHVERVAYLAVHGWADPIEVDVGIPSIGWYPSWPIQDGHHRLFAAIVRGDERILADVQGEVDEIRRISGSHCEHTERCAPPGGLSDEDRSGCM